MYFMSRGIDWLFLVSDDLDFREMLRRVREANLGTVVVGDGDRVLGRYVDLWISWIGVENGEVGDKDLVLKRRFEGVWEEEDMNRVDGLYSILGFDGDVEGGFDLDRIVDEFVFFGGNVGRMSSVFFDGEEEEEW